MTLRRYRRLRPVQIVLPARVLDAILQNASKLSKREILVLLAIWRHTLGENRIEARLSLRGLDGKLGISHKKIFPALRLLLEIIRFPIKYLAGFHPRNRRRSATETAYVQSECLYANSPRTISPSTT